MQLDHSHRAITNVRLLDPETETISEPTTLRMSDDRIVSIGGTAESGDEALDA
ncbi:hypothetical protein [Nesterenkonia pannonica]|nr:hypothetical protein [Nesterenkonia pannonica]